MGFDWLNFGNIPPQVFAVIIVWDLVWKALGLWSAIQNRQRNWFVAIFVLNTVGILPIIYLKFFQKKIK